MNTLVLASTSVYRRELLSRLQIPFVVTAPQVDETALPGEAPAATARRLSQEKARAAKSDFPDALIIGCDQVAVLDGVRLGKPHTFENARSQLQLMSGKSVVFHTAVCLYNSGTGNIQTRVVPYTVEFRALSGSQIENYLSKEQPYQCAGSARSEALGIALIRKMQGDDPNALVGLPLIALVEMLANEGIEVI